MTYDQPLYQKAREIIEYGKGTQNEAKINKVIVRLGGFYMLMSYLGARGFIMEGSGLKDVLCELYAEVSAASTGIIGDDKINYYNALEIGLSSMNRIIGGNFGSV